MLRRFKGFTLIELLIVVAIIAILAAIAIPNFLEAQTRSKVSRVKSDQRTLATALESYYIDNNTYPAQSSCVGAAAVNANSFAFEMGSSSIAQAALPNDAPLRRMPTFRIKRNQNDMIMTLTTPVAYITSFLTDPFADTKGAVFAYSISGYGTGWIVWSYGPDTDEGLAIGEQGNGGDLEVRNVQSSKTTFGATYDFPTVVETYFNAAATVPTERLLLSTYDPSNGTTSNGDVYRHNK